jgi:hypothetical protein
LESLRILAILTAAGLFFFASISRRSLLMLKKARLRPENIAECATQNSIPSQSNVFIILGRSEHPAARSASAILCH